MEALQKFLNKYPYRSFKKGETILLKGERPDAVHVIESGLVKTYGITVDGCERLVSIDCKHEDFPIGFTLGLTQKAQYFHEAFTSCTVRMVPRADYADYLNQNAESMYARQVRVTSLLLSTLSRVEALEQPTAGGKIAHTLLYMASRVGVVLRPYNTQLKIAITQQEIANALGISRETANTELKKLERMNLVSHSRKSYILQLDELRAYVNSWS